MLNCVINLIIPLMLLIFLRSFTKCIYIFCIITACTGILQSHQSIDASWIGTCRYPQHRQNPTKTARLQGSRYLCQHPPAAHPPLWMDLGSCLGNTHRWELRPDCSSVMWLCLAGFKLAGCPLL
ncbi:hypothetical protein J3E69DRAFT_36284 [Trichoderma sp. SZMC 28015]